MQCIAVHKFDIMYTHEGVIVYVIRVRYYRVRLAFIIYRFFALFDTVDIYEHLQYRIFRAITDYILLVLLYTFKDELTRTVRR